jgi:hypothetical protein
MQLNPITYAEEYKPFAATFRAFILSMGMRMVISEASNTATRFCGYIVTNKSFANHSVEFALLNDQRTLTFLYYSGGAAFAHFQWNPEQDVSCVFGDAAAALEKRFAALGDRTLLENVAADDCITPTTEEYESITATFRALVHSLHMKLVLSPTTNTSLLQGTLEKTATATHHVEFLFSLHKRTVSFTYNKNPFATLHWQPDQTIHHVLPEVVAALQLKFALLDRNARKDAFIKTHLDALFDAHEKAALLDTVHDKQLAAHMPSIYHGL